MFSQIKSDVSASIVVFCVALPLCLGIALASGAPLFSGIIAGIVGGIIVGIASGSALGVSGPAAGLAVIVLSAIGALGWTSFLLAVVIAGCIQLIMGYARVGFIAYFFPSSVIKGMLSGIGLLIILKQIPHALGYDGDVFGDDSFFQLNGETTLSAIVNAFDSFTPGAVIISAISIPLIIFWDNFLAKTHAFFRLVQGPIVIIVLGVFINGLYQAYFSELALGRGHLVNLPVTTSVSDFFSQFTSPNFSAITNFHVWKIAAVMAIVASLETLLCVDATDKLDPHKRVTPPNRELKAQGLGNVISGLLGGLPVTQVIVRSSANIAFGGKTKLSTILHGVMLLISAATIAAWLNLIPLASLSTILIIVGYKLANPTMLKKLYRLGWEQFMPFITTVIGILSSDLLTGILVGVAVGMFYTFKHSYQNDFYMHAETTCDDGHSVYRMQLAQEVSFFNKASIISKLKSIPANSTVIIDCSKSKPISFDVVELIEDYKLNAKLKNINVETIGFIQPPS